MVLQGEGREQDMNEGLTIVVRCLPTRFSPILSGPRSGGYAVYLTIYLPSGPMSCGRDRTRFVCAVKWPRDPAAAAVRR